MSRDVTIDLFLLKGCTNHKAVWQISVPLQHKNTDNKPIEKRINCKWEHQKEQNSSCRFYSYPYTRKRFTTSQHSPGYKSLLSDVRAQHQARPEEDVGVQGEAGHASSGRLCSLRLQEKYSEARTVGYKHHKLTYLHVQTYSRGELWAFYPASLSDYTQRLIIMLIIWSEWTFNSYRITMLL